MALVIVLDFAILGGKITKLRSLNSSSLPNVQRMHIIQYIYFLLHNSCNIYIEVRVIFRWLFNQLNHTFSC